MWDDQVTRSLGQRVVHVIHHELSTSVTMCKPSARPALPSKPAPERITLAAVHNAVFLCTATRECLSIDRNSYSAIGASITPSAPHAHGLPGPQPARLQSPRCRRVGEPSGAAPLGAWVGWALLGIRSLLGPPVHYENPTEAQMLSPGRAGPSPAQRRRTGQRSHRRNKQPRWSGMISRWSGGGRPATAGPSPACSASNNCAPSRLIETGATFTAHNEPWSAREWAGRGSARDVWCLAEPGHPGDCHPLFCVWWQLSLAVRVTRSKRLRRRECRWHSSSLVGDSIDRSGRVGNRRFRLVRLPWSCRAKPRKVSAD